MDSVDTAGGELSSPPLLTSGAHPDRVVSVWHALRCKGFSAVAAEHISCLTQCSTSTVFNARWEKWYFCCQRYGVDPIVPSVTDFFLSLWDEGMTAETIRGYCPVLASVFKYSDCSVFDGPEIAAPLKNLALERPTWSQEISQWPLPLVLSFLKGAPLEFLEGASLENLTRKTLFLFVLASGRTK